MNYEEFKEQLTENLKQNLYERTGIEYDVSVQKLQNESYEALSVRPENSPIAVSLDVQSLFKAYESGRSYDEVRDRAVSTVSEGLLSQPQINVGDLTDYDVMKEKLAIQVVATERNAEMLANIPHKEMEDMSLVCRFVVETGEAGMGSILVNNSMLENFGITSDQLFDDAMKYAPDLRPSEIKSMADMLAEIMGIDVSELDEQFSAAPNAEVPMYVPLLETLKSKGYKIGLISNCHSEEAMVIKQSILFPYFDAVCLSYDEGIKKPDHRIFEKCMEKLCVDAADCLYVGDGGSRELETAGEIGMHPVQAVWYLKEGTTQPTGRMSEFTNIENPLGVIEIILQTSNKLN